MACSAIASAITAVSWILLQLSVQLLLVKSLMLMHLQLMAQLLLEILFQLLQKTIKINSKYRIKRNI